VTGNQAIRTALAPCRLDLFHCVRPAPPAARSALPAHAMVGRVAASRAPLASIDRCQSGRAGPLANERLFATHPVSRLTTRRLEWR